MSVTEGELLTVLYEETGFDWKLSDDLIIMAHDSLELMSILQTLEEKFNVPLPIRDRLPLSYLLEVMNK